MTLSVCNVILYFLGDRAIFFFGLRQVILLPSPNCIWNDKPHFEISLRMSYLWRGYLLIVSITLFTFVSMLPFLPLYGYYYKFKCIPTACQTQTGTQVHGKHSNKVNNPPAPNQNNSIMTYIPPKHIPYYSIVLSYLRDFP